MADEGIAPIAPSQPPEGYFAVRGLRGSPWSAAPGTWFPPHRHGRTKHLFVTRGSISFNGTELFAPAGVRIRAGTEHQAWVGEAGVDCVEAFEPEG
jgi:redox-sensitive bicupin YhaK (pirin superfamily)